MRKSISNYPDNWPEIAQKVKNDAGWKCVRCGHVHDPENGYCLTVHHLDMDCQNNKSHNLCALCQRCHLSVQSKINLNQELLFPELIEKWFIPYYEGYKKHINKRKRCNGAFRFFTRLRTVYLSVRHT